MSHSQKPGLLTSGFSLQHGIHLALSIGQVIVSAYLTYYFFESHFPEHLHGEGSICDLTSFWNCGGATFSKYSHFLGVPISFGGLMIGLANIAGTFFSTDGAERTLSTLSKINTIGCLVLFLYSIIGLGSLCPMCTVYYILSLASALLFWKYAEGSLPLDPKFLGIITVPALIGAAAIGYHYHDKNSHADKVNTQIITEYYKLQVYGAPEYVSPYNVFKSTENFTEAPIHIAIFSDFECPFCKMVAKQMDELAPFYKGKINIKYYFYPLDAACNTNVKRKMHDHACRAAYLAACDPQKFLGIHDEIFKNQEKIDFGLLGQLEKNAGLTGCMDKVESKDIVLKTVAEGDRYKIQSTPTMIVNGVKIEGSLPNGQMRALFDEIIRRQEKK